MLYMKQGIALVQLGKFQYLIQYCTVITWKYQKIPRPLASVTTIYLVSNLSVKDIYTASLITINSVIIGKICFQVKPGDFLCLLQIIRAKKRRKLLFRLG